MKDTSTRRNLALALVLLFAGVGCYSYGSVAHHHPVSTPAPQTERDTNTEQYTDYGVNPFVETSKDKLSTFAIDVDTGSYTITRRKLRDGTIPPPESVRVEEFVNYFRYDYAGPDSGPFAVHMEAADHPFRDDPNRKLFRVAVQGKKPTPEERKPVHLTFLVDVSGSMMSPDKLPLAKRALTLLTNNLQDGDTVAIATYAGSVGKVLGPTGMDRRGDIIAAINSFRAGGSTAMASGMELAYEMATSSHQKGHISRVIVLSDGDANVGQTGHKQILKSIEGYVDQGIRMSTIGFGQGNYKDTKMEQLANKGDGNYYYIDSFEQAKRVFGDQLGGTLEVIAKDMKIQVEFNPEVVERYRLIGYENRDVADRDFRNDAVDGGELGAGHTVTALYELEMAEGADGQLAAVKLRHKAPEAAHSTEMQETFNASDVRDSFDQASANFRFATAVAIFAEILRESEFADEISLEAVASLAEAAVQNYEDRAEFVELVERASDSRADSEPRAQK